MEIIGRTEGARGCRVFQDNCTGPEQTTPSFVCSSTETVHSTQMSSLLIKTQLSITSFQEKKTKCELLRRERRPQCVAEGLFHNEASDMKTSTTNWQALSECFNLQRCPEEQRLPMFPSHCSEEKMGADICTGAFLSAKPEVTTDVSATIKSNQRQNRPGERLLSSFEFRNLARRGDVPPQGQSVPLTTMQPCQKQPSLHSLRRKAAALFKDAVRQNMLQGEFQDAVKHQIETRLYEARSTRKKLEEELRECTFTPKINTRMESSNDSPWWERLYSKRNRRSRCVELSNDTRESVRNHRCSTGRCGKNYKSTLYIAKTRNPNNLYFKEPCRWEEDQTSDHTTWSPSPTNARCTFSAHNTTSTTPAPWNRRLEGLNNNSERTIAKKLLWKYLGNESGPWILH